jgi:hypothetical protein
MAPVVLALSLLGCSTSDERDVAESAARADSDFKLGEVLDRMGRPELTNTVFGISARQVGFTKAYNKCEAFDTQCAYTYPEHYGPFGALHRQKTTKTRDWLTAGVRFLDRLDRDVILQPKVDFTDAQVGAIVDVFSEDALIVDIGKRCRADGPSFLDLERERLTGHAHQTCGGRVLNDDVIDDLLTLFIRGKWDFNDGPDKRLEKDWVGPENRTVSDAFPYLAPPHDPKP